MLQKLEGYIFRATDNKKLKEIYDEINKLEKTEVEEFKYSNAKEVYRFFVLAAVILILIEWILKTTFLKVYINVSTRTHILLLFTFVIPLMILGFLALNRWKNNTQNKYISSDLLKVLSPDISTFKQKAKLFLFFSFYYFLHNFFS